MLAVTLASAANTSSAQEAQPVEFQFGDATLVIDNNLVVFAGKLSGRSLGAIQRLDVPVGEGVYISLPKAVHDAFSPCDPPPGILLRHLLVPARSKTSLFQGLVPQPTEYVGISKLEPSKATAPLEVYQFDAAPLRDYWGDQISFYKARPLIRVVTQISQQVRMDLAVKADQCFFQHGAILVEQVTRFIASISTQKNRH